MNYLKNKDLYNHIKAYNLTIADTQKISYLTTSEIVL